MRVPIALLALVIVVPLAGQHAEEGDKKKKNPAIGNPQAIEAGNAVEH